MSHDKLANAGGAIRAFAAEHIAPIGERISVSPRLLYAAAFIILLVIAVLRGLLAPSPTSAQLEAARPAAVSPPAPAPSVQKAPAVTPAQPKPVAASAPVIAAAGPVQAELPAVAAPFVQMKSGAWQLIVQTVAAMQGQDPTALPGQTVGTLMRSSPTASFSGAVPDSMTNYVTMGKPVRLTYNFNFQAPTTGSYLLTTSLSGNASASARVLLDGRADPLANLKRDYNAVFSPDAPPVAGSASVTLAAGVHSIEAVLDTTAAAQAAHAPTLDLYIKPAAAPMPSAMVPLWPASSPAAPASAPAPQGARHG